MSLMFSTTRANANPNEPVMKVSQMTAQTTMTFEDILAAQEALAKQANDLQAQLAAASQSKKDAIKSDVEALAKLLNTDTKSLINDIFGNLSGVKSENKTTKTRLPKGSVALKEGKTYMNPMKPEQQAVHLEGIGTKSGAGKSGTFHNEVLVEVKKTHPKATLADAAGMCSDLYEWFAANTDKNRDEILEHFNNTVKPLYMEEKAKETAQVNKNG